jgi:hypothetical protein
MIYDFDTETTLQITADVNGEQYLSGGTTGVTGTAIDLTEGGGGVPGLLDGRRLYLACEVTESFAGNNTPVVQFGVALGSAATMGTDSHILALTGGSVNATGFVGFEVSQLTDGAQFHIPIPSWEDILESAGAAWPGTTTDALLTTFRGLKWFGLIAFQPMDPTIAIGDYLSDGTVKGRIVTDRGLQTKQQAWTQSFPSGMQVL